MATYLLGCVQPGRVYTAVRKHMHRHFSPTRAPACTGVAEGNHSRPPVKGQAQHQNVCAGSTKRSRCLGCGRVGHPTPAVRPDPRGGRHRAELLTIRGAIVHSETSENTRGHSRTDVALPAVVHVQVLLGPFVRQFGQLGLRTRTIPRAGEVAVQLSAAGCACRGSSSACAMLRVWCR